MPRATDAPHALLARCGDPGFTPGARDVGALLELWGGEGLERDELRGRRKLVEKALARGELGVARKLLADFGDQSGEQRAMRIRVLARIGGRVEVAELPELVLTALQDEEPRVVREAARAVGKLDGLDGERCEEALLLVCEGAALPELKAVVDALGRLGSVRARTRLERLPREDADLSRRIDQAITLIERRLGRGEASTIVLGEALPHPTKVRLRCRTGAEVVVADQVGARLASPSPEILDDATVGLTWSGTLGELHRVRTAIDYALVFALEEGDSIADRVVATMQQPRLVEALTTWTGGVVRFRLAFAEGGRRRAAIKQIAQRLTALGSPLINDSRAAPWSIEVDEARAELHCIPRGADTRFAYRHTSLPASSHPSLAALLAWVGDPQPGERVWDPFCGVGSELIECAMLQPGLELWGTDVDAKALAGAERNFAAAQVEVSAVLWDRVDACEVGRDVAPVSLILCNPPMGRRLGRDGNLRPFLERFIDRAARILRPGGRLVWVTPLPKVTANAGRRAGLVVDRVTNFDMGGFDVVVQRMRRPG